jgi:2-polyprenyl-6-methoxyphenol hydroxylase-like FAD-dependent oxidoreductase
MLQSERSRTSVLIVGAGPTGLVLALWLARCGVPFRLIDEESGPGGESRAMVVQARTLEFYQQLGIADEVVAQGVPIERGHLREGSERGGGSEILELRFADFGAGISPFPFVLAYPQDDHERLLVEKLKAEDREVEWNTKLRGFSQDGALVRAIVVSGDGTTEEVEADYVCGCDGAHSQVRESMGVGFPGGTYEQVFYVADVKTAAGFDRDLYVNLGENILSLMFPVRLSGMQRLIGLIPPELAQKEDLTFEDIRDRVEPLVDVKVTEVNWFSRYRVHHRVAERFRVDRAFLLGDAAHIHSPVGGQGMNTGIGDAVNLAWKLADVIRGRGGAVLLDSYEPERIGFARTLVATTDRAFTPLVSGGWRGEFVRRILAPLFFTVATRMDLGRHTVFRTISQTRIHYDDSPLSDGRAGRVHGGDRLPWVQMDGGDNFAPLRSMRWQAHVYGAADEALQKVCGLMRLEMHEFPWGKGADAVGFEQDALYLVRPDGYVALAADGKSAAEQLERYVRKLGLRLSC